MMRKYLTVLITAGALTLFTAAAASQSSSPSSNNGNSASSTQSSQSDSGVSSSNSSSMNNESSASAGSQKTLEGCIVKENTDYFLQPLTGQREKLNSREDLSSKVGQNVRVQGNEQNETASNSGSNGWGSGEHTTTGSASAETRNNTAGSIAGNAGSPNATGTPSSSANNSNGKVFEVTKVQTISKSCPAKTQNQMNQQQNPQK
jgi:hypothetical protein